MTISAERAPFERRRAILAASMMVPAAAMVSGVILLEAWRLYHPQSPLFSTPRVATLAEAIEYHDVRRAFRFIRAGDDPNALIVVRHPVLTDGQPRFVSPLWWAVAMQDRDAVLMLLEAGARIERSEGRDAGCLATRLGEARIIDVLRRFASSTATACP